MLSGHHRDMSNARLIRLTRMVNGTALDTYY